jgi:hypothetical protein
MGRCVRLTGQTWLVIGLVIHFAYGKRHSRLQHGETVVTEEG